MVKLTRTRLTGTILPDGTVHEWRTARHYALSSSTFKGCISMKANMSVGAKHSLRKYELLTNKCIGRQASLLLSLRCTPFKLHAWALPLCFNTVELGFLSEFYLTYLWDYETSFGSQIVLISTLSIYNRMGWHFISPSYCCITFENWDKKRYGQDARYLFYSAKALGRVG
jgi:hypothetical protein